MLMRISTAELIEAEKALRESIPLFADDKSDGLSCEEKMEWISAALLSLAKIHSELLERRS